MKNGIWTAARSTRYHVTEDQLGRPNSVNLDDLIPDLPHVNADREKWALIEVRFIGAENYVLSTKSAHARLVSSEGGFRIQFRDKVRVPAEKLMGPKVRSFVLFDVELHFSDIVLSLKTLEPESFPRQYTEGTVIGLLKQ